MGNLISPLLGFAGFYAGLLLWTQFTRWVVLLHAAASKEGGDFLGPPRRRLLWAIPFLALLHPAPWLLGAMVFLAFRTLGADAAGAWPWFFGGLVIALLVMMFSSLAMLARWRRMGSRSSGSSEPPPAVTNVRRPADE